MHSRKKRKSRRYFKAILVLLLLFLASGGFYGGVLLTTDPSGDSLHTPAGLLNNLPLQTFLLPGLFLLFFFGFLPVLAAYGLMFSRRLPFMERINGIRRWKWPATLSFFIGCTLLCWTVGEFILWGINTLSVLYCAISTLLIAVTLLSAREG
jgi:hypothetical protein